MGRVPWTPEGLLTEKGSAALGGGFKTRPFSVASTKLPLKFLNNVPGPFRDCWRDEEWKVRLDASEIELLRLPDQYVTFRGGNWTR